MITDMHSVVSLSTPVQNALDNQQAVVALESTIITHGMPYPQNVQTAQAVETVVTQAGATPATIAVIDGEIKIGLSTTELDALARSTSAAKLSRADLAFAVAQKTTGSTTVAATMIAAHLANIEVFATGGIGGVHRGASESFDISADLQELANTPVSVVSAGPKAILDVPKTLEVLESNGVPVVAYGQHNLPAFWSSDSGIRAPIRIDTPEEIVRFMHTRKSMGLKGGMLIGNPVPSDDQIPREKMEQTIQQAIQDAQHAGVIGKAVTPWLLDRIFELTNGASLVTNQALIKNNARLAGRIAVSLSQA